jgi:hypothetical protein
MPLWVNVGIVTSDRSLSLSLSNHYTFSYTVILLLDVPCCFSSKTLRNCNMWCWKWLSPVSMHNCTQCSKFANTHQMSTGMAEISRWMFWLRLLMMKVFFMQTFPFSKPHRKRIRGPFQPWVLWNNPVFRKAFSFPPACIWSVMCEVPRRKRRRMKVKLSYILLLEIKTQAFLHWVLNYGRGNVFFLSLFPPPIMFPLCFTLKLIYPQGKKPGPHW